MAVQAASFTSCQISQVDSTVLELLILHPSVAGTNKLEAGKAMQPLLTDQEHYFFFFNGVWICRKVGLFFFNLNGMSPCSEKGCSLRGRGPHDLSPFHAS